MSKETIIVRESYDWISEEDITPVQYEELIRYIEEKYPNDDVLDLKYKRCRFINFVGVIQCSDVRYEILPKINLSKEDERKALLTMLSVTNFLPISFYEKVKNGSEFSDLLSAFLTAFLERLLNELKKGVYKTYETHTDNLYVLKGKLQLKEHIGRNAFIKTRAYCSFDEHSENNLLNQLFKAALMIIRKNINMQSLKLQLERCLGYLENVDLIRFDSATINQIKLDRQNERFRDAALFAKLIIEHASIYSRGQRSSSFSFLFPMNLLFEKYIEVALINVVGFDRVISQHAEKRLLRNKKSGKRNILLKPDFVINEEIILDTKWKSAVYQGRSNYNQADIYQMYAYVTAYKQATRCILLYPKQEAEQELPIWEVVDTDKTIEMHTVRIDNFERTIEDLREILF
ncbi:McrC family protein [Bacillus sp. REN16]|uniref:McrC family protein n=1 Tax=Bacillus sp. REN16 TaxID=2887296 RepID=UPI001E3A8881|nr:McrC family protein [Bacillus sp. REN16]MCC3359109.1 McrC family protein [Bacillus sp. REN16]